MITPIIIMPMPISGGTSNPISSHSGGLVLLSIFAFFLWVSFAMWVGDRYEERTGNFGISMFITFGLAILLPLLVGGIILTLFKI